MLLCLGGSQADVTLASIDMCYAWIQKKMNAPDYTFLPHAFEL